MRTGVVALFFFLSLKCWAQIEISPLSPGATVFPGDVVDAKIHAMDDSLVNAVSPAQIRKWGESKTFLFMSLSPWQKDSSGWHVLSRIVLGPTFSPDRTYAFPAAGGTIEVRFRGWLWNPQAQQVDPAFDYENIPLLTKSWIRKNLYLVAASLAALVGVLAYAIRGHRRRRNQKRKQVALTQQWLHTITQATSLKDMSQLWARRDELFSIFPQAQAELRTFFDQLNKHQFRPSVAEAEVQELRAQRDKLLAKLREVPLGV